MHSGGTRSPIGSEPTAWCHYGAATGCRYIRYPEITDKNTDLFCDNVHLSHIGNDLFLYRIQQALQNFSSASCSLVSPPFGEFGPWQLLV